MKGKQQHAFPSLALISPLSGGSVGNAGGGWMEGDAPQTGRRRRGREGKQKGEAGVGGYLSFVVVNACM